MLAVAAAGAVHDPAHQHEDQHERDEPPDQRPVHGRKHIEPGTGRRSSGVERHLLVGAREGPRHLEPALLAEDEAQLVGWTKALGMVRTVGCARSCVRYRAEQVPAEVALLARRLTTPAAPICHAFHPCRLESQLRHGTSKRTSHYVCNLVSRKTQKLVFQRNRCKQREICVAPPEAAAFSAAFEGGRTGRWQR